MTTPPIAQRVAMINPDLIAYSSSQKHIHSVLEDSKQAILVMAYALQAVLNEVTTTGQPPYSADSYLPRHLIEMIESALGYPAHLPAKEAA